MHTNQQNYLCITMTTKRYGLHNTRMQISSKNERRRRIILPSFDGLAVQTHPIAQVCRHQIRQPRFFYGRRERFHFGLLAVSQQNC